MLDYNISVDTRSLYIHWPFCPYRCHFCPFVALASHDNYMDRYHYALKKEIQTFSAPLSHAFTLDTIYIGGGTPSTYPNLLLVDMFNMLKETYIIKKGAEITIEVNPGTVRQEQPQLWSSLGITRMSVGVQSLKEKTLQNLNRLHSVEDVYKVFTYASPFFDNISVDLILGLPGVQQKEWKQYLKEIVTWPITHISVYFLMVHENTPLYFKVQNNKVSLPKDTTVIELYYWTRELLVSAGFYQYEISNFAKPGYESKHNIMYWERYAYKGFGLGACSFDGQSRFQNEKNLIKYLVGAEKGENVINFYERLTDKQIRLERLMLGLRRPQGVLLETIIDGLTSNELKDVATHMAWLKEHNFVNEHNGYVTLTQAGLIVENEIVARLSS